MPFILSVISFVSGPCKPCEVMKEMQCFCGQSKETRLCGSGQTIKTGTAENFSCTALCKKSVTLNKIHLSLGFCSNLKFPAAPCMFIYLSRLLSCSNHHCSKSCHPGPCPPCPRSLSQITTCACGQTKISALKPQPKTRLLCTDRLPTCGGKCSKLLSCGTHRCQLACHDGPCEPEICEGSVVVKCECGGSQESFKCKELSLSKASVGEGADSVIKKAELPKVKCNSICRTLRNCGKHQCANRCCQFRGQDGVPGAFASSFFSP
jgi:transcriptional repressor NF-X1